ncbi:MAG: hypothetical protein ABIO39_14150 [Caulobacteraceae bacterium]
MNTLLALALGAAMASSVLVQPYEVAAHRQRMKDAERLMTGALDGVTQHSKGKAASAGRKLSSLLAKEEAYWRRSGLDDALSVAQRSLAAAGEITRSAEAGQFEPAAAAVGEVRATCIGCHELHPENRILIAH